MLSFRWFSLAKFLFPLLVRPQVVVVLRSSAWIATPVYVWQVERPSFSLSCFGSVSITIKNGTEPCFTPLSTVKGSDSWLLIRTRLIELEYQLLIILQNFPLIPVLKRCLSRIGILTESKAFLCQSDIWKMGKSSGPDGILPKHMGVMCSKYGSRSFQSHSNT